MPRPLATLHVDTERGWRGGEQQMAYLLDGLRRRGHRAVAVVQPDGEARVRLEAAGHEVVPLRMRGEADALAVLTLARRIGRMRPDVVHLHTSHAHTLGAAAARLAGRPVVIVSRRVDFSIYRNSFFGLNGVKYRVGLDRILCVSHAVREVLRRDGVDVERLRVVRSAVDPARVRHAVPVDVRGRLGLPPTARIVLAVGALVEHKGHRALVEALPRVLAAVPEAHVVVLGEGPLRGDLEELARALLVGPRLSLPGRVDDVPGWFASAEAFCMPSLEEGLGTSVLDAMAAGLPVVASDAGGIPEMVRDGVEGFLVPPRDGAALAQALVRVLTDADLRAAFSFAARARVDGEFHVDRMVEETLTAYREALRERRFPPSVPSPF